MQPWPAPPAAELSACAGRGLPFTLFCSRFGDGRACAAWRQACAIAATAPLPSGWMSVMRKASADEP